MNRAAQKIFTRNKLSETALGLFSSKGFEQTQISDISKKAGVAHGTFYVHYENKEAILEEALVYFNVELQKRTSAILSSKTKRKPDTIIKLLVAAFLTLINERKALVRALASGYGQIIPGSWAHQGLNPQAVALLTAELGKLLPNGQSAELISHAVFSIWARLGIKFALDDAPDMMLYQKIIHQSSLALLKEFVPLGRLLKFLITDKIKHKEVSNE